MRRALFLAFCLLGAAAAAAPAPNAAAPGAMLLAQGQPTVLPEREGSSAAPLSGAQSLNAAVVDALDKLGYRAGAPRDKFDAELRAAIKAFQADHGLAQSGRISKRLVAAIATELNHRHVALHGTAAPQTGALHPVASGTGIVVSATGYVLTNHHVINGCVEMRVGDAERIDIAAIDDSADLALLKLRAPRASVATFRDGNNARPGEDVVVLGYPLYGLLGKDVIVTTGSISALAGFRNDHSQIQISAPTQPGNSGGPVLDGSGHVVGIVVSLLAAFKTSANTAIIPENVNFAINEATARRFLDAQHVKYQLAVSDQKFAAPDIADRGNGFTLLLECWATHALKE